MNIKYQLISPSGNLTAIINGQYSASEKRCINQKIFATNKLVEQIGYIFQKDLKNYFEMMGNEFSGNGCRAATLAFLNNNPGKISFFASGINKIIIGKINNGNATVTIPSQKVNFIKISNTIYSTVIFNTLMIISANNIKDKSKIIEKYSDKYNAIGFMSYQKQGNQIKLNPWFWVKETNSLINETACGSGSIVVAKLLTKSTIFQPSGQSLKIGFNKQSINLSGPIKLLTTYNVKI